jgi:hypothetical protein
MPARRDRKQSVDDAVRSDGNPRPMGDPRLEQGRQIGGIHVLIGVCASGGKSATQHLGQMGIFGQRVGAGGGSDRFVELPFTVKRVAL